jgi:bacillithiol system protein YtxJ
MRSLFDWLSGEAKESGMNELTQTQEFEAVLEASNAAPQLIFKHSTTCPTSASAYRRMADYIAAAPAGTPPVHLVKVIESRPVSNSIAQQLGVTHQSPQIILLNQGAAVWNTSHGSITANAITQALAGI